jgi:imidazolonepropionase-like amidohydrolase
MEQACTSHGTTTHVHLRQADTGALSQYLRAGITTVRDMNGRPFLLEWRERIRRGELRGPTLLVASPTIGNFSSPREGYPTPRTFDEGRDAVRRFHSAGYDWIKIYSFIPAEGFRGIMAEASALGIPVGGHVPVALALDSVLRSGVRSVEHLTEYAGTSLVESSRRLDEQDFRSIFHAGHMDTALLDALIDSTIKHRVWNVASVVWFDRHLPVAMARQAWADTSLRSLGASNRRAIVRRMHAAGALLAIGTDSDAGDDLPAAAIHDELAAHFAAGIPTMAALSMATIEGARLLGIDDEVGSVHAGKRVDLLVLPCNAEEDLSCLRAPEVVIARGRVAR